MQEDKSIMRYEPVLPTDFDGVFKFSNPSDEDFVGVWGSKQYLYPAQTTSPMVIPEHSPLEVQHIRKKFARDLAEREWFKSKGYKGMRAQEGTPGNRTFNSIHQAATYTVSDLEPYIQMCLKPLATSKAMVRPVASTPMENRLTRNEEGRLNTEVVDKNTSLRDKALGQGK